MGSVEFRILGPVQALVDGQSVPVGAPKQRALLASLLLSRAGVVTRERLIDAIWGEDPPSSAAQSLQVYVHGLRKSLGADRIETRGTGYRIRLEDATVDLAEFERLVGRARRAFEADEPGEAAADLGRALGLWTGPPLADIPAESPVAGERARLEEARLQAIELRNEAELACGRHEGLVAELQALVGENPYHERLHEQLILALYRSGRQNDALEEYRAARRTLVEDLGLEPGERLQELERAVLRRDPSLAAPAPRQRAPARLPAPPTPLVGRRLELAAVAALFRDEGARLVTLTGPGGTGKTRLAIATAAELASELRDGAVFVDLAPLPDPALVLPTIASALDLHESGTPLARVLSDHLHDRRMLLVLDNLEHLLPAAPIIAELLTQCRHLLVLATSRAPLRLAAEHEYGVPPLPTPVEGRPFEELVKSDAVLLFAARARAVDSSFQIVEADAQTIARICRRLDGLPLAIELAAAHVRLLEPREIERRLDRALDLLVSGPRDAPLRHQTLRATLDGSFELLGEDERRLFTRLAVFAGGWTVAAAEAVDGDGRELLAPLATLVELGLVRKTAGLDGSPRFTMLETIREYALEQLVERGEATLVRERHCRHFVGAGEAAYEQISASAGLEQVYRTFEAELDNYRVALEWAGDAGEIELEARLAVALRHFWYVRGHLAEGRAVFTRVRERTAGADSRLHASVLTNGAQFFYRLGDLAEAKRWWEEAIELWVELGDDAELARTGAELGAVAFSEGALEQAQELWEAAKAKFTELGADVRTAICAANLAETLALRGELEQAASYAEEAVELQRRLGEDDGLAVSLHGLARIRERLGDLEGARRTFADSLRTARKVEFREVTGHCLEGAAEIALADGKPETAARLLALAQRTLDEIGAQVQGLEAEGAERTLLALREKLDADRLAAIERETADITLDAAVNEALQALNRS